MTASSPLTYYSRPIPGTYQHSVATVMPRSDWDAVQAWLTEQFGPRGDGQRWTHWFGKVNRTHAQFEVWFRDLDDCALFRLTWVP